MKYKTVDLCAGIGGIRKGFELTGKFKNVLSAEIDELACQTYEHNFPEDPEGSGPRNDLTSDAFKEKLALTKYDALLAGFPCQTFSRVGKRLGFRDETKGTIFFDIAEMIQRTQPKFVFLENVENLVRHDKGHTFNTIIRILETELDYKVVGAKIDAEGKAQYDPKDFIRNSKDFGMPQNRPRVYIIAFNRKYFGAHLEEIDFSLPTERAAGPLYKDLTDILEKGVVSARYFLSEGYLETLEKHKVRQNNRGYGFGLKIVNAPSIEHPIASALLATGGSGRERNLIIDRENGEKYAGIEFKGKYSPINSKNIRTMTPLEWGRLQGFIGYGFAENGVETFSFPEKIADIQKYKQFGNSVTIPVIEEMANYILQCTEVMQGNFSVVEKRLYTMHGMDFLMCYELYQKLGETLREATYLQWIDAYYAMGLDKPFTIKELSDFIGFSYPRAAQILLQQVNAGFAEKLERGKYQYTSHFVDDFFAGDTHFIEEA